MTPVKTLFLMLAGAAVLTCIDLASPSPMTWIPVGAMGGLLLAELLTTRRERDQSDADRVLALEKINANHLDFLKRQSERHGGVQ